MTTVFTRKWVTQGFKKKKKKQSEEGSWQSGGAAALARGETQDVRLQHRRGGESSSVRAETGTGQGEEGLSRELTFRNDSICLLEMPSTRSRSSTWQDSRDGEGAEGVPGSSHPHSPLGHYLAEGAMELPPAHDELGLLLANALQAA